MKKIITILLAFTFLLSIGVTSYGDEAHDFKWGDFTADEKDAINTAVEFISLQNDNMYVNCGNDTLAYTIEKLDDSEKELIIKKAEENKDEIDVNHPYKEALTSANSNEESSELDNVSVRMLLETYPDFLLQYERYARKYNAYNNNHISFSSTILDSCIYLSDSGFAYVKLANLLMYGTEEHAYYNSNKGDSVHVYVLLYHHGDRWIVCDVAKMNNDNNENNFAGQHRFSFNSETVDNAIELAKKTALLKNNCNKDIDESDSNSEESTPINYISWIICLLEATAIFLLAIAIAVKNKKTEEKQ